MATYLWDFISPHAYLPMPAGQDLLPSHMPVPPSAFSWIFIQPPWCNSACTAPTAWRRGMAGSSPYPGHAHWAYDMFPDLLTLNRNREEGALLTGCRHTAGPASSLMLPSVHWLPTGLARTPPPTVMPFLPPKLSAHYHHPPSYHPIRWWDICGPPSHHSLFLAALLSRR